jgi:hypothetical protein
MNVDSQWLLLTRNSRLFKKGRELFGRLDLSMISGSLLRTGCPIEAMVCDTKAALQPGSQRCKLFSHLIGYPVGSSFKKGHKTSSQADPDEFCPNST